MHHRAALARTANLMSEELPFTAKERNVLVFGVSCEDGNGEGAPVQDTLASFQETPPHVHGRLRVVADELGLPYVRGDRCVAPGRILLAHLCPFLPVSACMSLQLIHALCPEVSTMGRGAPREETKWTVT